MLHLSISRLRNKSGKYFSPASRTTAYPIRIALRHSIMPISLELGNSTRFDGQACPIGARSRGRCFGCRTLTHRFEGCASRAAQASTSNYLAIAEVDGGNRTSSGEVSQRPRAARPPRTGSPRSAAIAATLYKCPYGLQHIPGASTPGGMPDPRWSATPSSAGWLYTSRARSGQPCGGRGIPGGTQSFF